MTTPLTQMNILMLGGARRVSVARHLKRAGRALGVDVTLYSYELSHDVAVASEATIILGKRWGSTDIAAHLDDVIDRYGINIVIPFVDGAVEIAAQCACRHKDLFAPSCLPRLAEAMMDKIEADRLFHQYGFPLPDIIDDDEPVILKPRFGAASKGIVVLPAHDKSDERIGCGDYLVQRYINDRREITVDCYVSAEGKILAVSPRERLEVVGGEVVLTETIEDEIVSSLTYRVLNSLHLTGAVTVQWLVDNRTNRPMLMEINPRLGGGVVASVAAGADIISLILCEAMGMPLREVKARPGVKVARYLQEIIIQD